MNNQTVWFIIIWGGLLTWLTVEFFDHLRAFKHQNLVNVLVSDVSCGGTGGSNITVSVNDEESSLKVTRTICNRLNIGQQIEVLQSTSTGKFYWNTEPLKRVFLFHCITLLMVAYQIYWNKRNKKKAP